jgi:large subunit ribosomal protein L13
LNKTTHTPRADELERRWWVIDLEGKTLGRVAAAIAHVLLGKHKPDFTPHLDNGDFVIAVNCEKVLVTGKKSQDKMYYRHSGYPGGIKEESFQHLIRRKPERIIELAVKNMLPKNSLGRKLHRKLKAYKGPNHPHQAQNPEPFPERYIKAVNKEKDNG